MARGFTTLVASDPRACPGCVGAGGRSARSGGSAPYASSAPSALRANRRLPHRPIVPPRFYYTRRIERYAAPCYSRKEGVCVEWAGRREGARYVSPRGVTPTPLYLVLRTLVSRHPWNWSSGRRRWRRRRTRGRVGRPHAFARVGPGRPAVRVSGPAVWPLVPTLARAQQPSTPAALRGSSEPARRRRRGL